MNSALLALRLPGLLARAHDWVCQTVAASRSTATPIAELRSDRLAVHFDASLLESVGLVACQRVPTPPLQDWNLPAELAGRLALSEPAGLALDSLIFVRSGLEEDESLVFHELVHAIQWRRLGPRGFLAMYGLCLLRSGYHDHPLERTAYALQSRFNAGELPGAAVGPLVERALQEDLADFRRQSVVNRLILGAARLRDRLG